MRHKLTENIVYLQNEIRKRDDLLENSSEFGDFEMIDGDMEDDSSLNINAEDELLSNRGGNDMQSLRGGADDQPDNYAGGSRQSFQMIKKVSKRKTMNQAMQNQLDDARNQLKQRIEEKLQAERQCQNVEHYFRKVVEGLVDIKKVLRAQDQPVTDQASSSLMEGEQSSQLIEETEDESNAIFEATSCLTQEALEKLHPDDTVHQIISKIYGIQRAYESELSELKHRLKMQQMKIEGGESLKFDIELLTDEKNMLKGENDDLVTAINEAESKFNECQKDQKDTVAYLDSKLIIVKDNYEKQISQMKQEYEIQLEKRTADAKKQIEEMHETFKSQMIPAVKEKYQTKYQKLQEELQEVRTTLTIQLEEEKQHVSLLELESRNNLNQS